MDEENLFDIAQVWVWMLIEYYNDQWTIPTATMKWNLFQGLVIFLNNYPRILFENHQLLLSDICKLAGRISRISWNDSKHYGDAVNIMIENFFSGEEFEKSLVMIFFSELMAEMQKKESKVDIKSFRILNMTDIFIAAFQYFNWIRRSYIDAREK